ncbi:MAG: hypothetical protein M1813_008702 [Trichoglossum hirsutum]|nr:MAG: hypothetical protein M1813_008702 [Trichoglossum hirsutum]
MRYHDATLNVQEHQPSRFQNRGRDIIVDSVYEVIARQSQQLPEGAERLAIKIVANNAQVLADLDALEEQDRQLPVEAPIPIPRNTRLQQRKLKGSTKKRALTGAEASERQENTIMARTRFQTRARARMEAVGKAAVKSRQTRRRNAIGIVEESL